ncbi:hypothetical protein [Streptomyces zingiberis]|uniref:Uncharacterized protein n=1 Tax=Streptomyces zingiberis TaxID=2053010 RepID=A0ABX1C6T2_9ACTN|nr:hypothetical protein [Streptomyces zingiberis]NJQ02659.1 hypothetical protein [Streptomyces zingiberis]
MPVLPGPGGGDPPRPAPSWARPDPLDDLAERLADVCAGAVHPDEIAAVLEAEGLTDERAAAGYGRRDAFELAAELYHRVPRRHPEPRPAPDPWAVRPWRFLLRGAVFTLPGLGCLLAAPYATGPGTGTWGLPAGTGALAASAVTVWAWSQAVAHRAYARMASGGRGAAARSLRAGAPLTALAGLLAALVFPGPVPGGTLAFAAGQSLYLASATVLLVLGRERLLLTVLLPPAAGAVALGVTGLSPGARIALPLLTAAAAPVAAVRELRDAALEPDTSPPGAGPPGPAASVPYGLFGLGCAVLTAVAVLGEGLWPALGGGTPGPAGAAVLALTASMGAAEWLLHRFRSLTHAALRRSRSTGALRRRAGGAVLVCLAGYLALLAALQAAAEAALGRGAPPEPAPLLAGLALGAVLWTGLLLQAFGKARIPAVVCLLAAAAECAAAALGISGPAAVQMAVLACAAAALLVTAVATLGRATAHR